MTQTLRIAVTADLHWGHGGLGDAATQQLRDFLAAQPPDVLVLAGDIGTAEHFAGCLGLFADLPCRKAVVPGNHDIWVDEHDKRGDSLQVYQDYLPTICRALDYVYLDQGPLLLPEVDTALVGTMNWYDYTWALDALKQHVPDWEERLRTKRFSRGRHNDQRFVRWPLTDVSFTAQAVATVARQLREALAQVKRVLFVTHHPAFRGISTPDEDSLDMDRLLWRAFSGNVALEQLLLANQQRIALAFSGHTHWDRENKLGSIRGWNVGGDYHYKRVLLVDWPAGTVEAHTFGDPNARRR